MGNLSPFPPTLAAACSQKLLAPLLLWTTSQLLSQPFVDKCWHCDTGPNRSPTKTSPFPAVKGFLKSLGHWCPDLPNKGWVQGDRDAGLARDTGTRKRQLSVNQRTKPYAPEANTCIRDTSDSSDKSLHRCYRKSTKMVPLQFNASTSVNDKLPFVDHLNTNIDIWAADVTVPPVSATYRGEKHTF